MKVKDLIELLSKEDPEKEVLIQQGEDYDYVVAQSIEQQEFINEENVNEDEIIEAIVIKF